MARKDNQSGQALFMISAVAQRYDIHPQTLRLYEREGLLKPSRTEGNTRLYSQADLERLETILTLTRDLGAERTTDWVADTMNLIVNTRYNDRRPTIFTSNYEDVSDDSDLDSLRVRVGFRMYSRLKEMCEFLQYDGPDYREFDFKPEADDLLQRWQAQPRGKLPRRATVRARAQLRDGRLELPWEGGKAGGG